MQVNETVRNDSSNETAAQIYSHIIEAIQINPGSLEQAQAKIKDILIKALKDIEQNEEVLTLKDRYITQLELANKELTQTTFLIKQQHEKLTNSFQVLNDKIVLLKQQHIQLQSNYQILEKDHDLLKKEKELQTKRANELEIRLNHNLHVLKFLKKCFWIFIPMRIKVLVQFSQIIYLFHKKKGTFNPLLPIFQKLLKS